MVWGSHPRLSATQGERSFPQELGSLPLLSAYVPTGVSGSHPRLSANKGEGHFDMVFTIRHACRKMHCYLVQDSIPAKDVFFESFWL